MIAEVKVLGFFSIGTVGEVSVISFGAPGNLEASF